MNGETLKFSFPRQEVTGGETFNLRYPRAAGKPYI
nr:MAG TPA: hypothetical protein [Caudoviricetes sp.]